MYDYINTLHDILVFLILSYQIALESLKGYTHGKPIYFLGFHLTTH
jgi:hypothetical protein